MEDMEILLAEFVEELKAIYRRESTTISRLEMLGSSIKQFYAPIEVSKRGAITRSINIAKRYLMATGVINDKYYYSVTRYTCALERTIATASRRYMDYVINM